MPNRARRSPADRAPLTREAVVEAAVAMADAEGLDRLSMRRLGERLGVEAMSLYHHVPNKTALLDAMVDQVFAEMAVPQGDDWRAGLRERAVAQRAALRRHGWALAVMESRATPGYETIRHHDATLGFLRRTGFTVRATGHAYALLDAYVMGFLLQEQQLPFDDASAPDVAAGILDQHAAVELPHLAEFMSEVVLAGGYDFADEFDVGLDLVLDAVGGLRT
ncbi:TetR/AcrR family transcriptional regulator [Nocardioides iriomotensis]|uniref:TetR/AcrR family transcriptional regulator n=1 Tax=Nocardioides iriomotensis TaxID=715784 RepID=A0A4Q5J495_9ACTN|nr:TetR/AcrR family transcriptional regulator [Nocardioides iriomotensis]RYU12225.1 TetR/AcrR family transcriptional regulator [Nocardioides iriomotensis]